MKYSYRRLAKQTLRQLIWETLNKHSPDVASFDIALVGSRRSGSTLLMQVLSQEKGLKSVDQPFCVYTATSAQLVHLPWPEGGLFIQPSSDEQAALNEYIEKIRNGYIHVHEPWRFWQKDFDFRTNRLVLKTTDAHYLVDLLRDAGFLAILYFRHPIPQAISCARNNWGDKLEHFASHYQMRTRVLSVSQSRLLDDTIRSGTQIDRYVLCWCLENMPLFHRAGQGGDTIYYERMVIDPDSAIEHLKNICKISTGAGMREIYSKESRSVRGLSDSRGRSAIRTGDAQALVGRWLNEVDKSVQESAQDIMNMFPGCPYSAFSSMPLEKDNSLRKYDIS